MFAVSRKPFNIQPKINTKSDQKDSKLKFQEHNQKQEGIPKKSFEITQTQPSLIKQPTFSTSNTLTNTNNTSANSLNTISTHTSTTSLTDKKPIATEPRRIRFKLSIIKDVPYSQKSNPTGELNSDKKTFKKNREIKMKNRRVSREGNFNCGRWQPEEHERFIQAIMKYGNEWKSVQKHVGSRSSTQARSHAQKFFVKMKKANLLSNLDFSKNSIKTLHEFANSMTSEDYVNAVKALNCVAFERKNNTKRKPRKDSKFSNSSMFFSDTPSVMNLK